MNHPAAASAPIRLDLAGGWTDVGPYPYDFGGEVVNFAINLRVTAELNPPSDIEVGFPVQRGSGLGTSSALQVALEALSNPGEIEKPHLLAEKAFFSESEGGNFCGRQDQWASSLGGFNHLLFIGDSVEQLPFEPMRSSKNWLKKHFILANTGISRISGEMQAPVWKRYAENDSNVKNGLHMIRSAAREMASGLQNDRRDLVVNSLRTVCIGVDMLDPSIHEPFKHVVEPLLANGSIAAWKAIGAGGGGCAGILCTPSGIESTIFALKKADWSIIDWDFEYEGVRLES